MDQREAWEGYGGNRREVFWGERSANSRQGRTMHRRLGSGKRGLDPALVPDTNPVPKQR